MPHFCQLQPETLEKYCFSPPRFPKALLSWGILTKFLSLGFSGGCQDYDASQLSKVRCEQLAC